MADEHIGLILRMLEEGKITAKDAEALIASVGQRTPGATPPNPPPRPAAPPRPAEPLEPPEPKAEPTGSKQFDFRWANKSGFPLDLGNLGKQITDAVRKIDPDKILKEVGVGGRKFQERMRSWQRMWEAEDDEAPQNPLGWPTATQTTTETFALADGAVVQVDNPFGDVTIVTSDGGHELTITTECWAPTQAEAEARLAEAKAETYSMEAGTDAAGAPTPGRLEIRVATQPAWRDGVVHLTLKTPADSRARVATAFGAVGVTGLEGQVDVHTTSGAVHLTEIGGEVAVETVSGSVAAQSIRGAMKAASKSGDIQAAGLAHGVTIDAVSGDVKVTEAEGGRVAAKSVSGDVSLTRAGLQAPVDVAVESVSGDVRVVQANGAVSLKVVSGDIEGRHIGGATLQAQTVSGDIRVEAGSAINGTVSFNTVSGDVSLAVPAESNFRLTLTTQSGDMACDLAVTDEQRSDSLLTGAVGTGAGTVAIQTLSGDIHITPHDLSDPL